MDETGLYVMSVAAELMGLHPSTLRLWERKGLLTPARSDGGTRLYSEADIVRLRRISALTDDGVNLEGVRRILDLEDELAALQATVAQGSAGGATQPVQPGAPESAVLGQPIAPCDPPFPPRRPQ